MFLQGVHPRLEHRITGQLWHPQPDFCVLLLDNVGIYDAAADELLQNNGMHLQPLSVYSPDFLSKAGVIHELRGFMRHLFYND